MGRELRLIEKTVNGLRRPEVRNLDEVFQCVSLYKRRTVCAVSCISSFYAAYITVFANLWAIFVRLPNIFIFIKFLIIGNFAYICSRKCVSYKERHTVLLLTIDLGICMSQYCIEVTVYEKS